MVVDKKSWHYRVLIEDFKLNFYNYSRKTTLCTYFWMVVASVLLRTILVATVAFLVFCVGAAIGVLAYGAVWGLPELSEFWGFPVGLGLTLIAGAVLVGVLTGLQSLWRKFSKKTKEPGLLRQWVKAKKGRYCPTIEFKQ